MGRPNQTYDMLDALLDGRPGEVTDDLAPLLAAAEALRAELADLELDPEVVDRHLEQALDRPATVVTLPVRRGRSGVRRRLAAVALAAALVLVPATAASAASASALPGQALYPVKLAVEQFRLAAVQWSAAAEAKERTRLAATRLRELDKLVQLRMFRQIPPAIRALDKAVVAARVAVQEAVAEEGRDSELVAAARQLDEVTDAQLGELVALKTMVNQLPPANRVAIRLAVQQSPVIAGPLPSVLPSTTPATTAAPNSTGPPDTGGPPASEPATEPTSVPTTQPEPPTTVPPTTTPPTTEAPPASEPPPTTAAPEGEGSPAGVGSEASPTSSTGP
jgi:hypothetical protein